jgi:hypothetical protein
MESWSRVEIARALEQSSVFVERALVALYELQTPQEKAAEMTAVSNGVGFNAVDAPFLSSLAEQVQRRSHVAEGYRLSPKQIMWARKKLKKYGRQLVEIADATNPKRPVGGAGQVHSGTGGRRSPAPVQ